MLDSIVLITSAVPGSQAFGTGFLVQREGGATYLLTCAHVVAAVGGAEQLRIGDRAAALIAAGEGALDLAVLRVDGLTDRPLLRLERSGKEHDPFVTAGFQRFGAQHLIRPIRGTLGAAVELAAAGQAERARAWDLAIVGEYRLQIGYSGSPVAHEESGRVFAVASHMLGEGEKGVALSLEVLPRVWREMPAGLLAAAAPPPPAAPPRPAFSEIKQRTLQWQLSARIEEYDALNRQLEGVLGAVEKLRIRRQMQELEQEITGLERQLAELAPSVPP
jgi:hypothetical protein